MKELSFDYLLFVENNYPLLNHLYKMIPKKHRIKFNDFCVWVKEHSGY